MASQSNPKDAINFLAMVRDDLKGAGKSAFSTIVTGQNSEIDVQPINDADTVADEPAAVIGRFKVVRQIGEGGFAKVFLANDPNLDRHVALKVPKPDTLLSKDSRSRFEREAKAAAILSHPNIVPVFESGSVGPIHFIASQYCAGETLRERMAREETRIGSPREAAEIVCTLADAVQHAHQRGIIHRDLKPANIIVVDGKAEVSQRVRITDFGLARHVADMELLTVNGAILGTPAYMSPEQAKGVGEVTSQTDVYSLGMILYELLTGKLPFKRKNHAASIAAVINEAVPNLRLVNSKVDRDLEAICQKALNKDPAGRYSSPHHFSVDLQNWINDAAVSARSQSSFEKLCRMVTKNPVVATAISFGVVSLTIGFLFSAWQWKEAQSNLEVAIQQQSRAERNAEELHGAIVKAIEISLDAIEEDSNVTPAQQEVMDELISAHKRLVDAEAQVEITTKTFECYRRLAKVYQSMARYEKATEICDQAVQLVERCFRQPDGRKKFGLSASTIFEQRGLLAKILDDVEMQEIAFQKAIELFEQSETHSDRDQWIHVGFYLHRNIGYSLHGRNEMDQCIQTFERAAEFAAESLERNPESEEALYKAGLCSQAMARVALVNQKWPNALECLEEAERQFQIIASNPESEFDCRYRLCYIRNEIAFLLRVHVKDYERSEEYSRDVIAGLNGLIDESPNNFTYINRRSHAYQRLIHLYRDQGLFDELLELIPEANRAHRIATPRWRYERIAGCWMIAAEVWQDEFDDPQSAHAAFDHAIDELTQNESFSLENDLLVDKLLDVYRLKSMLYGKHAHAAKAIEMAGVSSQLAVQRALLFPNEHNAEMATSRCTYYARRLAKSGEFGLAKATLESFAEVETKDAMCHFKLARTWAYLDFVQRRAGESKSDWEGSRANALRYLKVAVDSGFKDDQMLAQATQFQDYRHIPKFEACFDKIQYPANAAKIK